jgi:GGDEF domain-containing protein
MVWEMTCSKQLLKGLLKSLARWGGDEFTILFTKLSGRDALLDAPLSKKPSHPLLFSKTIIYTSLPVLASPYIHKLE